MTSEPTTAVSAFPTRVPDAELDELRQAHHLAVVRDDLTDRANGH